MGHGQGIDALQLGTCPDAPLATDAFAVVLDDGWRVIVYSVIAEWHKMNEILVHDLEFRGK